MLLFFFSPCLIGGDRTLVQWDKGYTTEEELIQVRTRIAENRRKTMIGTTYKKNSNFRLPPLLFFANLASLWSSYTAAKKFLSLFHMCELVVLEGHLPSITACEKEKKNHQLWRNKHWMQRFCRDKELLLLCFATFWQLPFKRSFSILRARCKKMSCTGLKVRKHGRRFLKFLISEKHINHETTSDCEIYWPSHDSWPAGRFS